MKTLFLISISAIILLFTFADAIAADMPPVYYWQLIKEGRYIHLGPGKRNWREIREWRKLRRTAGQEIKRLKLKPLATSKKKKVHLSLGRNLLDSTVVMMRDPNGAISILPDISNGSNFVKIPKDEDLIGRYLLGAHISLGNRDVDGDGVYEFVHICAKYIIRHSKNGGKVGSASVVFFDDARQMPFEIGPAINTAKSKYGGGTQLPNRSYEMQVKYLNKPLPGAAVTVINIASQWEKRFVTDDKGKFEIIPPDHRGGARKWQKYLYVATHHDRENNAYYVTTFPTVVYKNQPEWLSKTMGFTYWVIVGSIMIMLMVVGFVSRKKRQDRQALIVFENYKIQKDQL